MVSIRKYACTSSPCKSQICRSHTWKLFMAIYRIWAVGQGLFSWEACKFLIHVKWLSSLFLPPLPLNGILRTFPEMKDTIFLLSASSNASYVPGAVLGNKGQINENNGASRVLRDTHVCKVQGGGGRHRRKRGWHHLVGSGKISFLVEVNLIRLLEVG